MWGVPVHRDSGDGLGCYQVLFRRPEWMLGKRRQRQNNLSIHRQYHDGNRIQPETARLIPNGTQ